MILINYVIKNVGFILGMSAGHLYSGEEQDVSQSDCSHAVTVPKPPFPWSTDSDSDIDSDYDYSNNIQAKWCCEDQRSW